MQKLSQQIKIQSETSNTNTYKRNTEHFFFFFHLLVSDGFKYSNNFCNKRKDFYKIHNNYFLIQYGELATGKKVGIELKNLFK